jgi:heme/copper-type cytochrome/quinol oxidase subunit 2
LKRFLIIAFIFSLNVFSIEDTYLQEKKYTNPIRQQSVIVSKDGYFPNVIHAFSGEKLKFFVTSTTTRPSCFTLPSKDIFLPANKGEITESVVYFDKPGVYEFNCPAGGAKGKIVVREHPAERRARIKREIASEKRIRIWRPRDE